MRTKRPAPPPLRETLLHACEVRPRAQVMNVVLPAKVSHLYKPVAFAEIHPELYGWLERDMYDLYEGNKSWPTQLARRAKAYLHWIDHPDAPPLARPLYGKLVHVTQVNAVSPSDTPGHVVLSFGHYQRGTSQSGAPQVMNVRLNENFILPEQELDSFCAGSCERLQIAWTLNLQPAEVVRYVFTPDTVVMENADLPETLVI